ncbi:MAG: IS200/IS605 family transposase [Lachnospiraceae bacterium]|nr:IS200/IS605 family transposase [Lachnospiraceae bacterium]
MLYERKLIHSRNCVYNINYHIVWSVKYRRKISVTNIVKNLKGITGRKLFEKFPELRKKLWKGGLWNHSYYCETIGSVSENNIRRYIEHQSKTY